MATFYIEAVEDTDIALRKIGMAVTGTVKYGVDDTTCPNTYNVSTSPTPISLTAGQKCYWTITSTSSSFSSSKLISFTSTGKINVGGDLSDLIGGQTAIPRDNCFYKLFASCKKLVDASNLIMINNFNSKTGCYSSMFSGCTSLTTPPELPATTLADSCYSHMFDGCTSLTTPPELPATILANQCYYYMFSGCTSLTTAPELLATTLTNQCYYYMFNGCTSIKLSETQTASYPTPYRIPSEGTGTEGTSSLTDMFTDTGGTFTGTPIINTTYYIPKVGSNVQLYDGDIKLYPITRAENVRGLEELIRRIINESV